MAALGLCCCMCAYSCGSQASPCSACSSCGSRARGHTGFSGCGSWAQGPRDMSLVVPWRVGSSRTRDRTRVPCDGKRILNHWATREVQFYHFLTGLLAVQPSSFVTKMFLSPPPQHITEWSQAIFQFMGLLILLIDLSMYHLLPVHPLFAGRWISIRFICKRWLLSTMLLLL